MNNGKWIIVFLLGLAACSQPKPQTKSSSPADLEVKKPLPNMDITSPYTVKGQAKRQWYFEGSLPVKLYDARGKLLAEGQAKAQGNWMTNDFVPFEVTLNFNAPDDERGKIVFEKANPSGLQKNADSYSLPVIFPPK